MSDNHPAQPGTTSSDEPQPSEPLVGTASPCWSLEPAA